MESVIKSHYLAEAKSERSSVLLETFMNVVKHKVLLTFMFRGQLARTSLSPLNNDLFISFIVTRKWKQSRRTGESYADERDNS